MAVTDEREWTASVLLSGGIDSAACTAFYLSQGLSVQGYFVDYGQAAGQKEAVAARRVARHFAIPLTHLKLTTGRPKSAGLIAGRNAFLIFAVLQEMETPAGVIAIGVHSGTSYYDCSAGFITRVRAIVEEYTDGAISVASPFLDWTKREIWEFCVAKDVPLDLTYSCELGQEQPCGHCLSCKDLEALHAI